MSKHWRYFIFLLWISYLMISGILLFARGFLLSRDAFTNHSNCMGQGDIPCSPAASSSNNITNGHEFHCSQQDKLASLLTDVDTAAKVCFPAQAKVILLIVDALRYDFTEFDQELEDPLPYQNKLPVISETLNKHPSHSRLFKFIADPPTTTMQRLKALTTGSLPTFVDAGSNFATPEINEDNLIDQMVRNNKSVVFMGDDTWAGLYPNRFKRCWNFPSFNVWDLDTVDRGIEKNIFSEMSKSDWDLLITHFLGVDHCGHRYGPNHPEMARKLTEINKIIKEVIEKIDDNTMLFIIGDHGMTKTGDHGGESDIETTAAMFIYSTLPLNHFDSPDSVKQIDMIPTLSTILGIPIPFSNLGTLILDALPIERNGQSYLKSLWANIRQTHNYIKTYSERSNQFSEENLQYLSRKYENLKGKINKIKSEGQFKSFVKESREFLKFLQNMCIDVWVQFDSFSMTRGLLLLFLTLFFTYLIIDGIPTKKLSSIFMGSYVYCSLTVVLITALATIASYYMSFIENVVQNTVFSTGMVSIFMLGTIVVQNWEDIAINWYESVKKSWLDTFTRAVLLLVVCTLFSNSYVIEEGLVFSYLILSLLSFIIYNTSSNTATKSKTTILFKLKSIKFKLFATVLFIGILLRLSNYYSTCREEQKWCMNFTQTKTSDTAQCVLSIVTLAILATVVKLWLRSCGNLVGFSPTVMMVRYAPTVIVVCSGGYWVLQKLSKEPKNHWQTDSLAWVVYTLSTIGIISAVIRPLCVYVFPRQTELVNPGGNVIPQLFKKVKESLQSKVDEAPIVCGLATVYSAGFVIVSVFMCLVSCLLLGGTLAPSGVLMYFTAALVLFVLAVAQQHMNSDSFDVPNWSIITWCLLSTYFFYGTGHAAEFPSIHWGAGFVGRTGGSWGGDLAVPALLVTLETFCAQLLFGLTLPVLLIAPHTLTIMFPGLCPRGATSQGEVALFEQETSTYDGLFALCCKYFLCHGIRMFACALAATIHCRHLMVWKIFAPKFMFETASIFITLASVILGYLMFVRIHCALGRLLSNLYKQRR